MINKNNFNSFNKLNKLNKFNSLIAIISVMVCLTSCNKTQSPTTQNSDSINIITVAPQPLTTHLYYAGTIQPLKSMVITSPADGVVEEMLFHYGDTVKAQQPLFILSSTKFQADYKSAIMQYIKAKTDYNNSDNKLKESNFLYKNELISKDTLKTDQTNYFNAQLSLIQAKEALTHMLKQLDIKNLNFQALNISEIDKISMLLNQQEESQKIHIAAPAAGVVLIDNKDDSSSLSPKVNKGSAVKQGDLLAIIGDLNGLTLHINVNEFNINQLKVGQLVKITGTAFPQYILQGNIAGIDHQAQTSQGGVPVFAVEITVPKLTLAQQAVIHVGMSAKITITINRQGESVISVPINAVYIKNNLPYIKMQRKNSDELIEVPVKTGDTTEDSVVILSPLKAGDRIAVPH